MLMSPVVVILLQLVPLEIFIIVQPVDLLTLFIVSIFLYVKGPLVNWGHAAPAEALSLHTEDEK